MKKERKFDIVMDMAKSLHGMDEQEETKYTNFVFFFQDNYFTLLKVVGEKALQGVDNGCVRTAWARKGWPTKQIAEINDKRFITLYHYGNNHSFGIFVGWTTMLS